MENNKVLRNLKINDTQKILIINPPDDYRSLIYHLTYDIKPAKSSQGKYDFIQVFATTQSDLETGIKGVKKQGKFDCIFWVCYPKITGKIKSDAKRETVWAALELIGLYAVTSVSIDDTWTALRGRPSELVKKLC